MKTDNIKPWVIWLLIVFFTMWLYVIQTGYAVFNIPLQKSLNLSIEQIGIAAAIYPCTAAVLQLFTGSLLDELGPRKTILPSIIVAMVGVLLFSSAKNYSQILISQLLFGCATCFAFVGCGYLIGAWFPINQFGRIFGLAQVILAGSAAFGQIGFNSLLRFMSWREIFRNFSLIGIVIFILAYKFIDIPKNKISKAKLDFNIVPKVIKSNIYVLKNKMVVLSCIFGGVIYGYLWAFGTLWLPKILVKKGLVLHSANQSVSCLWLGLAFGSIFVDKAWQKTGSTKKILRVVIIVLGLLLFIIAFVRINSVMALILSFLFGLTTSSHMLTYTMAKKSVREEYSGSAISIVNASMFMIGGIFVALIGYTIGMTQETLQDYQNIISWFSLTIVLAFLATNYIEDDRYLEEAVYE